MKVNYNNEYNNENNVNDYSNYNNENDENKDYDNESLNYDNLGFYYLFKDDNKSELRNKKKEKNNLIR